MGQNRLYPDSGDCWYSVRVTLRTFLGEKRYRQPFLTILYLKWVTVVLLLGLHSVSFLGEKRYKQPFLTIRRPKQMIFGTF